METFVETMNLLTGLATVVGVGLTAYQLWNGNRYRRKKDTLDYYESVTREIREAKKMLGAESIGGRLIASEVKEIYEDEGRRFRFHRILNIYERLAVGINSGIYDIALLNRLTGGDILRTWVKFEPYIEYCVKKRQRSTAWCEFRALVASLKKHRVTTDGCE